MSHTAYFQKLLGKTIADIEHKNPDGGFNEAVAIKFTDGTVFVVQSFAPYSLDARISPDETAIVIDYNLTE